MGSTTSSHASASGDDRIERVYRASQYRVQAKKLEIRGVSSRPGSKRGTLGSSIACTGGRSRLVPPPLVRNSTVQGKVELEQQLDVEHGAQRSPRRSQGFARHAAPVSEVVAKPRYSLREPIQAERLVELRWAIVDEVGEPLLKRVCVAPAEVALEERDVLICGNSAQPIEYLLTL